MGTRSLLFPGCVRGLLFEVGNVFCDNTLWRRWVLRLLAQFGLYTNYHCFFRVWDRDYLDDVHRGRRSFCEAFAAFLLAAGLSRGQIDEVQAACQARRREHEATARPLPGVKTTLDLLHRCGLVLGVCSNSELPASALQERLERLGIGKLFATVVSSIDLQRTMPDPACYLAALGTMNLSAQEVALVSSDTAELAGAAALGMSTVAFNFEPDARADVYLHRFDELSQVAAARAALAAAG